MGKERPLQYRKVRRDEDEEEDQEHEVHLPSGRVSSSSSCILPCLLLSIILLALALGLLFVLTAPNRAFLHLKHEKEHQESTTVGTTATTTRTTPTQSTGSGESELGGGESENEKEIINFILHGNDTIKSTNSSELNKELIKYIHAVEKKLERLTGLEAELLVPLAMFALFLATLGLASCCCCLVAKGRERRRRELYGKIITDLQAGDAKKVLLDDY